LNVIHKDCNKDLSKDKSLPRNSYLVTYIDKDKLKYDIVQASCFVEVFDNYYDELGKDKIKSIKWTDGAANPKTYGEKPKKKSR